MENFIAGDKMHKVKDYLLTLIVDDVRLFVAVEKGSEKMSDILLMMLAPKQKLVIRKWTSTVCGKEVIVKDKLDCLITFAPHDLTTKIEHTEYLENFLAQEIQDLGAMKLKILKIDATAQRH